MAGPVLWFSSAIIKLVSTFIASAAAFASHNVLLAYFIIYLATIFIGNISAFASFWLTVQGYLGPQGIPPLIIVIFLANVSGDLLWYTAGRTLRNTRLGYWIQHRIPGYEKAEAMAVKNGRNMMFFSKFVYASAFPLIFSLGWIRLPLKKFLRTSALAALLWMPILFGLSYAVTLGFSPLAAAAAFKDFGLIFLAALMVFIVLNYLVARIFEKATLRRGANRNLP